MSDRVIYSKFSDDRAKEFSIYTNILKKEDNSLFVKKYPEDEKAMTHVRHIYDMGQALAEAYDSEKLKVNPCFWDGNGVRFSFAEGDTLENRIDRLLFGGKEEEAKALFISFADFLLSLAEKDARPFQMTTDFEKVFGQLEEKIEAIEGKKEGSKEKLLLSSLKLSNIDLIPANIMVSDHWEMIDYEWTFEFPIPLQFILYRMIYLYLNSSTRRKAAEKWGLYEAYGITEEKKALYAGMETHFQSYIQGKRIRFDDIQIRLDPGRFDIAGMLEQSAAALNPFFMQVFYSESQEFSEEASLHFSGIRMGKNQIEISLPQEASYLRIDPLAAECLIADFSLCQREREKEEEVISIKNCNGKILKEGKIGFLTEDPQIYMKKARKAGKTFRVEFTLLEKDRERVSAICQKEEGLLDKIKARAKGR